MSAIFFAPPPPIFFIFYFPNRTGRGNCAVRTADRQILDRLGNGFFSSAQKLWPHCWQLKLQTSGCCGQFLHCSMQKKWTEIECRTKKSGKWQKIIVLLVFTQRSWRNMRLEGVERSGTVLGSKLLHTSHEVLEVSWSGLNYAHAKGLLEA